MKSLVVWTRSGVRHQSDLRVFFLEHFRELLVALDELWSPLLIAHANHFQIEGGRVSHPGTQAAPRTINWTISELNQVQGILNVWIQLIKRDQFTGIKLAGHAAIYDRKRRGANVFTQLEIFIKSQSERLIIIRRRLVFEL